MAIWTRTPTLPEITEESKNTVIANLGIEYLEIGDDYIKGRMPVDERTVQPFGILHGGASVVLAETLASMAANCCLKDDEHVAVGLEINANHISSASSGWVYGTARPVHIGGSTQVWEIRIESEQGRLVCISRLTMAVVRKR